MTTFASSLSSRGWAFLVFTGGFVLAVPFFKGGSSNQPQYTSSTEVVTKNKLDTSARSELTPSTVARVSPLSTSSPIPNESTHPPARSTIEAAGIVESKRLDRVSAPLASPAPPTANAGGDGPALLVKPPENGLVGAAPIHTELPSWAKKPSLLDAVVTSNSTTVVEHSAGQNLPPARKPSPYHAWTPEENSTTLAVNSQSQPDRYSPFRALESKPLTEKSPDRNTIRWPDEDPRTAVASPPPIPERLVGRDAMIRDPKILQKLPEQIGRTVVHPGTESLLTPPSLNPSNLVVQPKFGQVQTTNGSAVQGQVGAALRSKIPPDEQLFIRQPALQPGK